ncbi:CopG family transcriptional regulator [filamentous cyanobacterium CCP1]|nr:CopG family transcriptional regulator [filamentous cyanobacterium CCP2]PSB56555.1 CopG family transcriptional regulator [filamentous cyanobacterium CCP1]
MSNSRPTEQLAFYVSPEEKKAIQAWAEEDDRSVSYLLRSIVLKALKERHAKSSSDPSA